MLSTLAGLGLGITLMLELAGLKLASFTSAGPLFTVLGRLTGMVGTYGMILTLFLIARIPLLEREVGFDRTVRWHRKLAPWSLLLVGLHVLFIVVGYAITEIGRAHV